MLVALGCLRGGVGSDSMVLDVLPEILLWICMLILASINAGKIKQSSLLRDSPVC